MLTLITGVPGAGKTLYCVDKILRDILGTKVLKTLDDGTTQEIERTIYTNIKGLVMEHVLIDGSEDHGIRGWHKWCKPGDFIVYDEVQKEWPPRSNGSKVPDYIQHLETHRHMGVDFVILTQHPALIDANVRALIGRHLHIRRLSGSFMTIVYEWDHCSRQLLYSKSITKKPYRYNKTVFDLYKSSDLHTKQTHSKPFLLWVVIISFLFAAYFIPQTFLRISEKNDLINKENKENKDNKNNNSSLNTIPVRMMPDSDNSFVASPVIDDLYLAGHAVGGGVDYPSFGWAPAGVFRSALSRDDLDRFGYQVLILRFCVVRVSNSRRQRILSCLPSQPQKMDFDNVKNFNTDKIVSVE